MNVWTKRAILFAIVTVPTAAFAAVSASGGTCVLGSLFGCGG